MVGPRIAMLVSVSALALASTVVAEPASDPAAPPALDPAAPAAAPPSLQFHSSHLFDVPTAQVVGAYQLELSGDASLLGEPGVLSTTSLLAIGFGDLAQLEYRHSSAVSSLESYKSFGLPTLGVQIEAPLPRRRWLPTVAVALRYGLPHDDATADGSATFAERATDLYVMASYDLGPATLHAGVRFASASIEAVSPTSASPPDIQQTLMLPAFGASISTSPRTSVIAEFSQTPSFAPGNSTHASSLNTATFARAGVRWALLPGIAIDTSVGYHLEVARLTSSGDGATPLDWDVRIGAEFTVPWGALACRSMKIFCQ